MQKNFNSIEYLIGDENILCGMSDLPVLPIFSDYVLSFLDNLSSELLHDTNAKKYPDIISYAFWIRKANMKKEKDNYVTEAIRFGRGVAFQIAPSNIPVQFAISMTYALISGNASVVRVSSKHFEQVDIICECIARVLNSDHNSMKPYICVIRYDHNDDITQSITDLCDVRMIWGGDKTITSIRKTTIGARCIDLGFADRYSIAVFDSDAIIKGNVDVVVNGFYNDTFLVDQNACSSPRIVIWIGKNVEEAKEIFWNKLEKIVEEKYEMNPISSSDKLLNTALFASYHPDSIMLKKSNLVIRMDIPKLYDDVMQYKGNCGYFFEYTAKELKEIVPLLKKECQTVVYLGDIKKQIVDLVDQYGVHGIDRIVTVGHATDISFVWDGLDLPNVLSRQIGNS